MGHPRRTPLWSVLALAGAMLLAGGCQSTEYTYLDVAEPDVVADTAPADVSPADTPPADVAPPDVTCDPDAGPPSTTPSPAGGPCKADKDCFAKGKCFTTQVVNNMFDPQDEKPEIDVPNGMCTRLLCSGDADCGPGGKCFDATPLTGSAMKLCGWPCVDPCNCRWSEGYTCYFTGKADEVRICLPQGLVDIIDCGNGTCDSWPEQGYVETHDSCPRDCP
jgi:hypothetical protein